MLKVVFIIWNFPFELKENKMTAYKEKRSIMLWNLLSSVLHQCHKIRLAMSNFLITTDVFTISVYCLLSIKNDFLFCTD